MKFKKKIYSRPLRENHTKDTGFGKNSDLEKQVSGIIKEDDDLELLDEMDDDEEKDYQDAMNEMDDDEERGDIESLDEMEDDEEKDYQDAMNEMDDEDDETKSLDEMEDDEEKDYQDAMNEMDDEDDETKSLDEMDNDDNEGVLTNEELNTMIDNIGIDKKKTNEVRNIVQSHINSSRKQIMISERNRYNRRLKKESSKNLDMVIEGVETYLERRVQLWESKNSKELNNMVNEARSSNLMKSFKKLYEEHGFSGSMSKSRSMELKKLQESNRIFENSNAKMKRKNDNYEMNIIFEEFTKDMYKSEDEQFTKLVENSDFSNIQDFTDKCKIFHEVVTRNNKVGRKVNERREMLSSNGLNEGSINGQEDPIVKSVNEELSKK